MTLIWLALGTLVSEDLACITAGILVSRGQAGFWPAAAACTIGIFGGDFLLYLAGRFLGRPAVKRPPLRWLVGPEKLQRAEAWFARKGTTVVPAARFLPGSRLPTYVAAGVLKADLAKFLFGLAWSAALWTPGLVGLSALLGNAAQNLPGLYWTVLQVLAAGLAALFLMRTLARLLTSRGRRLMLSSYMRLRHWEYWPRWAFYPPVILYICRLSLRYRSLTLFTAANPAIPTGGLLGESKAETLDGLTDGRELVARYALADSPQQALAFMRREGLSFPLVLKPDTGQRGLGVAVVRSEAEVREYFRHPRPPTIVQEHAEGLELGIFYYRFPGQAAGRIFSITEKRLPSLEGDGKRTLEELILADPRAVAMARYYFKAHQERLESVPAAGQKVSLGELGNHCRGAQFLDGKRLWTPEAEAVFDRLAHGFAGFYFGRFDICIRSLDEFRQGRGFKVIELNGVASEAGHIYHPGAGLLDAYRTVFAQWRICFEIAAVNRSRGEAVLPFRQLLRQLLSYRPPSEAPRFPQNKAA